MSHIQCKPIDRFGNIKTCLSIRQRTKCRMDMLASHKVVSDVIRIKLS